MNMYADRGNVICLVQRCRWRGIEVEVRGINPGPLEGAAELDIMLIGGGQDREQWLASQDLVDAKGPALRDAVGDGLVVLAVCGGYQLFGEFYRDHTGTELRGIDVLPAYTIHPGAESPRCIGNIVTAWQDRQLVGFENHGGRTYLRDPAAALATVQHGFGNNGEDKTEGAQWRNVFGTYLHGSLLPKNPALADHLILKALQRRHGVNSLPALDDALETSAHRRAVRIAGG
jgi:hypothetical protein